MRMIGAAFCMAAMLAVGLGAQTGETNTKTKVKVKDGKDVTVAGCVEQNQAGEGFVLTNVGDSAAREYLLVGGDNLSKHVGHRVEIKGKATDMGHGKIETETRTKTKVEHGKDQESHEKYQADGNLGDLPVLGVKSVKILSDSCR